MGLRFLVSRLSALGDVVFAVPAVQALRERFPDASIDWLVEDRNAALVQSLPGLDRVFVFPRKRWKEAGIGKPLPFGSGAAAMWQHYQSLRKAPQYDAVFDFQGNLKSSMQLRWVRAGTRVGFDRSVSKEGAERRYNLLASDPGRVPRAQRDLQLVHRYLAELHGDSHPPELPTVAAWQLDPQAVLEVDQAIATDTPDFVLIHHGFTPYGRDKEWTVEAWGELCRLLRESGRRPRLLWTPGERDRAEQLLIAAQGSATLAPATPSLQHLMALLDRAQLLIGTDSGPVHLSALRGNPVLALYGPTDAVRFRSPGPKVHTYTTVPADQEPPKRDRSRRSPLMDAISPSAVFSEVEKLGQTEPIPPQSR